MTREEALNKVRQMTLSRETMEILQALVPELKDSDDERTRKEIINYLDFAESHNLLRAADCEKKKRWLAYLEKQKEQKHEWNDEDKSMLNKTIAVIKLEQREHAPGTDEWIIRSKAIRWIESLPERLNPKPKQEWGEDDEALLSWCISDIERAKRCASQTKPELCDIEINWLKSLKPRWKPSDEQMEALKNSAYGDYQNGDGPALRELYEQLKNL